MGIYYVKIADNEFRGLKKVFFGLEKKLSIMILKKVYISRGVKANLEKVYILNSLT